MGFLTSLLRRYGNAGAVANAYVELELSRRRSARVDVLASRLAPDVRALATVAA